MDSPLRKRLANDKLREMLDRFNSDMLIGPNAPGDGDILLWHHGICWMCAMHLAIATRQGIKPNPNIEDWELPISTPRPKLGDYLEQSSAHFIKQLFYQNESFELKDALNEIADDIAHELSIQWGGRRIRVGARRKFFNAKERIADELRNKTPIKDIPEKTGISRATVYRTLKKRT